MPRKKRKAAALSRTAEVFAALVKQYSFQQGPNPEAVPLTNFTFFVGAGFSKSWEPKAPVGKDLFTLDRKSVEALFEFVALDRALGVIDEVTLDDLRQLVYQLDMFEKYPDVCSRYIDPQNIQIIRGALRASVMQRYEELAPINYRGDGLIKFPLRRPTREQQAILKFFSYLHKCSDGSTGYAEGVRVHFATTNYDYVIETILDAILAPDDSHHNYTYRGFTPFEIAGLPPVSVTHQHWLVDHLLKLNGGFEILREGSRYRLDYRKRNREEIIEKPPILMLPSREQDYSDTYFETIFSKAVRLMRDTRVLVLVGYSLPEDDALMRFILRQFAEEPEDGREKLIFYVDPLPQEVKIEKLQSVYPSMRRFEVPRVFTFEGGFAKFCSECLVALKR